VPAAQRRQPSDACRRRAVGDFQSLTVGACDCEGFAPVRGRLRDATFAEPDPDPLELGLRVASPPRRRSTM